MMVKGGVGLARALRHCGLSRRAHYKKRPAERGIDTAVAKPWPAYGPEPTCGTRMPAHTAARRTGRLAAPAGRATPCAAAPAPSFAMWRNNDTVR